MILALLTAAALSYDWPLTPAGWGPVRTGMSRAQAEAALKLPLVGEAFDNEGQCAQLYVNDERLQGMFFMFVEGRLARISLTDQAPVVTPRHIGVGSPAEQVRKAYDKGLVADAHRYEDPPAEYLTYWLKPGSRGVRFEIGSDNRVTAVHAGDDNIRRVDGCVEKP